MDYTFRLNISCDNAAFVDPDKDGPTPESAAPEIARVLRKIAADIEAGGSYHKCRTIHDVNGNVVGTCAFKTE